MRLTRFFVSIALLLSACGSTAHIGPTATTSLQATTTTAVVVVQQGRPSLQEVVDAAANSRRVQLSIVAVDLATGERAEHLADREILSASLYKLFVAAELLRRIDAGTLDATSPAGNAGHRVDECIRLMIVVSDDGCGVAGLALVGRGALDTALRQEGYLHTHLGSPQRTTAIDVASLLARTTKGSRLYALLRDQQINDRLPRGLPIGTPIAHKTGDRTGWAHDAGIITAPRGEFLLVVMTGPWPAPCCHAERAGPAESAAFSTIAAVGRAVYAHFA